MLFRGMGAGDERSDFLLFNNLPVDEVLNVWVVKVEADHFCGSSGGAARLDGTGCAVANLEERHETGRFTTARERLALSTDGGKVTARSRTVFEKTRLTNPQIHDPTGLN